MAYSRYARKKEDVELTVFCRTFDFYNLDHEVYLSIKNISNTTNMFQNKAL